MDIDILVLNNDETIIGWLNPSLVDITEYNDDSGLQNIKLTHPVNDDTKNDYDSWLEHGNKIWISETEDLKSCLYVINAEKTVNQDDIIITAEEVLVELNNIEPIENSDADPITINSTQLNTWFGDLFNIGTIETGNKSNTTSFTGTINPMALLRQIEKDTGNYFITRYEKGTGSNVIHRYLDFKQSLGVIHDVPIEIGENTDKIELEINEEDTYTAIAPIIKCSDNAVTTDTVTAAEILSNFKSLSVNIGDNIPMIIEKKEDGTEVVAAYWNAPFKKDAGSYKVYSIDYTKSNYTHIRKKEASSSVLNKTGNIETSETNKYVIYNLCALALMDKQDPVLNITAEVKDLRRLQGIESSYCAGDTVYVRLPHRSGLVESKVTDTEKNPRLIGESKITIGNDVTRSYQAQNSIARSGMDTVTLSSIYSELGTLNNNINNKVKSGYVVIPSVTANTIGSVNVTISDKPNISKIICFVNGSNPGDAQISAVNGSTYTIQYKFANTGTNRTINYVYFI